MPVRRSEHRSKQQKQQRNKSDPFEVSGELIRTKTKTGTTSATHQNFGTPLYFPKQQRSPPSHNHHWGIYICIGAVVNKVLLQQNTIPLQQYRYGTRTRGSPLRGTQRKVGCKNRAPRGALRYTHETHCHVQTYIYAEGTRVVCYLLRGVQLSLIHI